AARSSSHTFLTGVFSANSSARDSNIFPDQAALSERMRFVERRDWWLWSCAVLITLLLTLAVVSFTLPSLHTRWPRFNSASASDTVLGLVGLVLLFDIYTAYQHFQIQVVRKQLIEREELFRLIS